MSIVAEAPGFLQVFSDGSVKRLFPESVPHSSGESVSPNGFKFKDVTIDSSKPITARMFIPVEQGSKVKLPVLVYFHGGGFCIGSTTWLGYHHFLGDFCAKSQCIIVSVDYRLAPENRLPVAYEDCYSSLEWLDRQVTSESEPWLRAADLSRVFLSGDSAGAEGLTRDYYGCNFEKQQDVSAVEWSEFPAVTVYVAGLDFLKERGVMYAEFLAIKGAKEVAIVEAENQPHIYHVFHPESDETRLLQSQMSKFIESH